MSEDLYLQKIVAVVAAAYFGNSHVTPSEIPTVINQIATSLSAIGGGGSEMPVETVAQPKLTPAQVRKSITRDALFSFEDNKPYKTLRRHLAVRGLSPAEYRSKWGLPNDYPMVAPAYSEARSNMAKSLGLGNRLAASRAKAEPPLAKDEPKRPRGRPAGTGKTKVDAGNGAA